MVRIACDGAGLLGAVRAAVANLESHVDEINALNVFPVPDGDTGSNMFATCTEMLLYVRDETSVAYPSFWEEVFRGPGNGVDPGIGGGSRGSRC